MRGIQRFNKRQVERSGKAPFSSGIVAGTALGAAGYAGMSSLYKGLQVRATGEILGIPRMIPHKGWIGAAAGLGALGAYKLAATGIGIQNRKLNYVKEQWESNKAGLGVQLGVLGGFAAPFALKHVGLMAAKRAFPYAQRFAKKVRLRREAAQELRRLRKIGPVIPMEKGKGGVWSAIPSLPHYTKKNPPKPAQMGQPVFSGKWVRKYKLPGGGYGISRKTAGG